MLKIDLMHDLINVYTRYLHYNQLAVHRCSRIPSFFHTPVPVQAYQLKKANCQLVFGDMMVLSLNTFDKYCTVGSRVSKLWIFANVLVTN